MFNVSIMNGKFPEAWKIAQVTPIFKNGEAIERSNYRPMSVLHFLSKLFEKFAFDQLYRYLDKNNILPPSKSGFRTLHSTVSSLLKQTDDWYSTLDDIVLVGVVFVDLKKASTPSTTHFCAVSLNNVEFKKRSFNGSIHTFQKGSNIIE